MAIQSRGQKFVILGHACEFIGHLSSELAQDRRFFASSDGIALAIASTDRIEARRIKKSMYDLTRFTLADMAKCGAELREAAPQAETLEAAASVIVRHLYENLAEPKGHACIMVRLYKTHAYGELPAELRSFGHSLMPAESLTRIPSA